MSNDFEYKIRFLKVIRLFLQMYFAKNEHPVLQIQNYYETCPNDGQSTSITQRNCCTGDGTGIKGSKKCSYFKYHTVKLFKELKYTLLYLLFFFFSFFNI